MPSETVTHFYNEIAGLAAKIGELKLPKQFIKAAKTRKRERIEVLLEQSEAKYPELWARLLKLLEEYEEAGEPQIFSKDGKEGYYKYNPQKIHPINLCFIFMFSEGNMTDVDVFAGNDWEYLSFSLLERGYIKMAKEVHKASLCSLSYNLMRVYGS